MSNPRVLAALLQMGALAIACPVGAHDQDVAELEARITALEATLEQLLQEKDDPEVSVLPAPVTPDSESQYGFGGYIKFDSMFSDYSGGDMDPGSAGSQFYIPATIPIGGVTSEGPETDIQGRESRINFRSSHSLPGGDRVNTFIELDFFVSPGGNERVSNSYNPRLRHAYFKYNNWLFGQTWSTFQDVEVLPENLDFIGPAESTTFVRQAQIRYTRGAWDVALENPETTVTPFGGGSRIVADDGGLPDVVLRHTARIGDGHIRAAALFRELTCEAVGVDDSEMGLGFSLSGKHFIGEDDIRWMATVGHGTGRYLGLNTANGVVLDSEGNLEAIDQWGAFVSYRHSWNDSWRSNVTYGYLRNDHDVQLTGLDETREVYSVHVNLLYEPVPRMTLGGEILFADRTLESGASGDMTRVILSAKYAF